MDNLEVMLGAARVRDPTIAQLMATAQNSAIFERLGGKWERQYEGSFMLFNRETHPHYGFIMLDRNRPDFMIELFTCASSVKHETDNDSRKSNTIRYSKDCDTEYRLAFESVSIAESMYKKLQQAVLLVSTSHRGTDHSSTQKICKPVGKQPKTAANKSKSKDLPSNQRESTAVVQKRGLISQLLTAKANYKATMENHVDNGCHAPPAVSSKTSKSIKKQEQVANGAAQNHNQHTRAVGCKSYYAKPIAPCVSLNVVNISELKPECHVIQSSPEVVQAFAGNDTNDSPSKTRSVRMQPISLTQLFGNAGAFKQSSPCTDQQVAPVALKLTPISLGLPLATSANGNGADDKFDTNFLPVESDDPLTDSSSIVNDTAESDMQLIAPDAFIEWANSNSQADADENRVLLDMVMMHRRSDRANMTRTETDLRVETGHSGTGSRSESQSAEKGVDDGRDHSSRSSNSFTAEHDQRSRQAVHNHALPFSASQLRDALIDILESDEQFIDRLHQHYTRLLLRPSNDSEHQ